jgi:hypothetical protein
MPCHACAGKRLELNDVQSSKAAHAPCFLRAAGGGGGPTDQLRDQRGPEAAILAAVRRSPPGSSEELGWAGCGPPGGPTCWPLGRWALGSVAGDPDRHRGLPGAGSSAPPPYSVPAAAGRGLRTRVSSAHRPAPQLQVQDPVMGRRPIVGIAYIQTGASFLHMPIF